MNELKSYTEYAVSTPTADFVIGFDFNYGEDAVNVTVDDVPATEAGYTVVYLNETTIRLSPSVPSGVVRLQRETDIDQTDHAYRAGAKFIAHTMDENFEQLRHSQQEVRDGFVKLADDTYEIIDTLEEVAQSAQDAADDANAAAQVANDAAAQVADKVSPSELSSALQPITQDLTTVKRYTPLPYIVGKNYEVGERVTLSTGEIVENLVPSNNVNPNTDMLGWHEGVNASDVKDESGKTQQFLNNIFRNVVVTPRMFGEVGTPDDTATLNTAINFAIANNATLDGEGLTYLCHSVLFDSNFKFKNAKLVCNKYDQDLISVLECSSYNDDPRWLENVHLWGIHIDGMRQLHTDIKDTTAQEDGGRSGFRFIRPVDGLTMIGCSGNNCASDGIIIFPHGDQSSINDTVKNVNIINSEFSGNRRHGGSSNSINGMKLINVTCNGNGLDINPSAPINSGLRGDTVSGQLYGSGWDCEEYALDVQSTNMFFNDCTMIGNAKSGLLVLTVGSPSGANKAVIEVNGGSYDIGVSAARDNWAILVTPVTNKNFPSTKLFTVNNVNLNGGDIGGLGVDNFVINHPVNVRVARALEMTTMFATGNFIATAEAASSVVRKTFAPDAFRFNYANNLMQLNTSADAMELRGGISDGADGKFKLSAYRGVERGSLEFRMDLDTGGANLFYSHFGVDKIAFYSDTVVPATSGGYSLGHSSRQFKKLYTQEMSLSSLRVFANNAAAISGGLAINTVYKTSTGQLMVVY